MKKIKGKLLAAAIALIGFSTAGAVTGTYAWFVAANTVSVSEMSIKAEAENGIVIANEQHVADSDWAQNVEALHKGTLTAGQATFIPTSTADAVTWYHANAESAGEYGKNTNGYITRTGSAITETETDKGVYQIDLDTDDSDSVHNYKNIYLLNKFYIQSSAATPLTGQDLVVKEVKATDGTNSPDLNKAIRVLFKATSGVANPLVYAPLATGASVKHDGGTADGKGGKIGGSTEITARKEASGSQTDDVLFDNIDIPAYTTPGTSAKEVGVYIYFEGEDFNCKSANIKATLDTLKVSFKLENKNN